MGVRIVVVFQHDLAHVWATDPKLGERIVSHVHGARQGEGSEIEGGYVVEVIEDNVQSLLVTDGYRVHTLAYEDRRSEVSSYMTCVKLLRTAAKNLGFNLFRNYFRTLRGLKG